MLIKQQDLKGIASGEITLAFRRWKRPTVRAGGTLRTPIGVLAIESVEIVSEPEITKLEARQAGYDSLTALVSQLRQGRTGKIYRIALHPCGPDPRVALRLQADLSAEEQEQILRRLERFDVRSLHGPWTRSVLSVISENPGARAAELAEMIAVDKTWFKNQVRKLKELGLTESLSTGYRLSPRGLVLWTILKT